MQVVDANKDGKLSLDEIKKHMSNSVKARMKTDDARVLEQAKKTLKDDFKVKDSNGDGFVTKTEMFKEFSQKDFSENEFLRHQDDTFDLADRNKDSKLDSKEFLEFLHPHLGKIKEDYKKMISKESHDDADGDQDGHITWEEHWNKATEGHDFKDDQSQFEELMNTEKKLFAGEICMRQSSINRCQSKSTTRTVTASSLTTSIMICSSLTLTQWTSAAHRQATCTQWWTIT